MSTKPATKVTASVPSHGLVDVPVLNPGDWLGRVYLIEMDQGHYCCQHVLVEAHELSDAIDFLSEDEVYGKTLLIDPSYMEDYRVEGSPDDEPEYNCSYNGHGEPYDTSSLIYQMAHKVIYHADHLPRAGCSPEDYTDDGIQAWEAIAWKFCEEHGKDKDYIGALCAEILETQPAGPWDWELLEQRAAACAGLSDMLQEECELSPEDDLLTALAMLREDR